MTDSDLSRRCRFCADVRPTEADPDLGWADVWEDVELQKLGCDMIYLRVS